MNKSDKADNGMGKNGNANKKKVKWVGLTISIVGTLIVLGIVFYELNSRAINTIEFYSEYQNDRGLAIEKISLDENAEAELKNIFKMDRLYRCGKIIYRPSDVTYRLMVNKNSGEKHYYKVIIQRNYDLDSSYVDKKIYLIKYSNDWNTIENETCIRNDKDDDKIVAMKAFEGLYNRAAPIVPKVTIGSKIIETSTKSEDWSLKKDDSKWYVLPYKEDPNTSDCVIRGGRISVDYEEKVDSVSYKLYKESTLIAQGKMDYGFIGMPQNEGHYTCIINAVWNEKEEKNYKGTVTTTFRVKVDSQGECEERRQVGKGTAVGKLWYNNEVTQHAIINIDGKNYVPLSAFKSGAGSALAIDDELHIVTHVNRKPEINKNTIVEIKDYTAYQSDYIFISNDVKMDVDTVEMDGHPYVEYSQFAYMMYLNAALKDVGTVQYSEKRALLLLKEKGLYGYKNYYDEWVIKPMYKYALPFSEGYAAVAHKGIIGPIQFNDTDTDEMKLEMMLFRSRLYGFIDENNHCIVKPRFESVKSFSNGYAYGVMPTLDEYNEPEAFLIDHSGKLIAIHSDLEKAKYSGGVSLISEGPGEKFFYVDAEGNQLFGKKFDCASEFKDGYARVCVENKWGLIDLKGDFLLPCIYSKIDFPSEGLISVGIKTVDGVRYGYIDLKGNVVIKPQFELARPFKNGWALVQIERGVFVYINHQGQYLKDPQTEQIIEAIIDDVNDAGDGKYDYSEGWVIRIINGKMGYMNAQGKMIINPVYSEAEPFYNGMAKVALSDQEMYVDGCGRQIKAKKAEGTADEAE